MQMHKSTKGKIVSHADEQTARKYARTNRTRENKIEVRETLNGWETKTTYR